MDRGINRRPGNNLARVGKMNLDLMDLRTIVGRPGNAPLIVGKGNYFRSR
ncbi:MAG: hypothetical protein Ct9H90mP26_2300 [Methanobacteriota archaeon]|nr:MAG: hypothetical protein Ct9H90mP26_2300 [Euryarchaeota archaeon]